MVHVDNLRLQQLLTNLLTNAAKFTEKGEINLSFQLAPDREKVYIAVTDTGAGIPLKNKLRYSIALRSWMITNPVRV